MWIRGHGVPKWVSGMCGLVDVVCVGGSPGCVGSWMWCTEVGLQHVWICGCGVHRGVSRMCGFVDTVCLGGSRSLSLQEVGSHGLVN